MNLVVLSGRLATDVQCRLTQKGKTVSNFLLAVPYSFTKDADGKYPTNFFSVTAFDQVADRCRDNLIKGRQVTLRGHLTVDSYKNKNFTNVNGDPVTIRTSNVVADLVEFLGYRKQYSDGKPKEDNEMVSSEVGTPPLEEMELPEDVYDGIPDEEIPF